MAHIEDPIASQEPQSVESLDLPLRGVDSVALARLIEEVRNSGEDEPASPAVYNRMYHRHNR